LGVRVHPLLKFACLWFAGAIMLALFLVPTIAIPIVPTFYKLSHGGVAIQGKVTLLEPEKHQTVYYSYEVDGMSYAGGGRAGYGNPGFSYLTVGETVLVYYLPTAPQVSCIGHPNELLKNEVIPLALGIIISPVFLILVNSARYPQFRNWLLSR
jgi:hypothetical protein